MLSPHIFLIRASIPKPVVFWGVSVQFSLMDFLLLSILSGSYILDISKQSDTCYFFSFFSFMGVSFHFNTSFLCSAELVLLCIVPFIFAFVFLANGIKALNTTLKPITMQCFTCSFRYFIDSSPTP